MSILNNKIRAWWIQKPIAHNCPTDQFEKFVVFQDMMPTICKQGQEWIRVISLDDFHKEAGMNITRWVELCNQLAQQKALLDEAVKVIESMSCKNRAYQTSVELAYAHDKENCERCKFLERVKK